METPPCAQQITRLCARASLLRVRLTWLSCLPLATEQLAGPMTLPRLPREPTFCLTSPPHLVVTVESLVDEKPLLASTPLQSAMQTLESLLINRTDRRIPWVLWIRRAIPCRWLQHLPFRWQTPTALPKPLTTPLVAAEARISLAMEPITSRATPVVLAIGTRVCVIFDRSSVERSDNRTSCTVT